MSHTIELSLRSVPTADINAASIGLARLGDLDDSEIARIALGDSNVGDWFDVRRIESSKPTLRLIGDLSRFHQLGANHFRGRLEIQGDIGDHAFAAMSGGEAYVDGDGGDHLGSPVGTDRIGMTGGRVVVRGNVGRRCGHRMRRGNVWVGGTAGDGLAAFMIAGTIVVAGDKANPDASAANPDLLGYGMNRGTVVLSRMPDELQQSCFTQPRPTRSPAVTVLARSIASQSEGVASIRELAARFEDTAMVVRGDLSVGGQGELWAPINRA